MDELQPGDPASVGGYRLLGRLGAGGMGQVFLGTSPGGRKVAVKLIHPAYARTALLRERFAREIEAVQRVGGFHTASVVDADPRADPPWMVTAYVEGPSLQDAVGRYGPLPPRQVRALGAGLAEGLSAIHACGLVHRDLKPGNVILAEDGPRIIDFGIARAVGTTTLTTAGMVMGTFAYTSPEQLHGEAAGPASDIFALGCVLAFAATGRPPFDGDSAAAVMFRIVSQPPVLDGLADPALADLISRCLAKAPQARPTVPDLLEAFSRPAPPPAAEAPPLPSAQASLLLPAAQAAEAAQAKPAAEPPFPAAEPPLPAAEPPQAAEPPVPPGADHAPKSRGRSRRWPVPIVAVVVLAAALGVVIAGLDRGNPRATASHVPAAEATIGRAAASPDPRRPSPTPVPTEPSDTPQPTAKTTVQATTASPKPTARRPVPARSTPPPQVEVPDVDGDSAAEAREMLQAAGFAVQVSTNGPLDTTYAYSPVGAAPRGSTVIIDVGYLTLPLL